MKNMCKYCKEEVCNLVGFFELLLEIDKKNNKKKLGEYEVYDKNGRIIKL